MKKNLALLLCTLSCAAIVGQSNAATALTQEQIEAHKNSATRIANVSQTRTPVIDSSGEIKRDPATGAPAETSAGTSSIEDKAKYFSNISGVTGYQIVSEPGRGGTAAANVSGSGFADFSCNLAAGAQKTVLGRVLSFKTCSYGANAAIESVTLTMCSVSLKGGACGPQDFTAPQAYRVGAYGKIEGLDLGVGCNESSKTCRITLNDSYSVSGTGSQLTAKASEKAQQSGENSAQGGITKVYSSDEYTEKMAGIATEVDSCAGAAQRDSSNNGVASTCGEEKKVTTTGPAASNPNCSNTPVCVRHATRSVSYGQTCVRTFPLTGYSCNFKIPTLECSVLKDLKTGKLTNSCAPADLGGANKVDSTESAPTCSKKNTAEECVIQAWTDYYTLPEKATLDGNCASAPFPLSGSPAESCLNHGLGTATTCQEGGWWRRTLTDSECTDVRTGTAGDDFATESISHLSNTEKAGCGVCINTTKNDTCYARPTEAEPADTCGNIDLSFCKLTSSAPESQFSGMTLSQQEVYNCSKQEDSCVEFDNSNLCTSTDMTFGTSTPKRTETASPEAMNRAMTDAALIDAVAQGTEEGADPFTPRIFSGEDMRCSKPVGWFSGVSSNDCCRLTLGRPGGSGMQNKCSMGEVKLATARRANFTAYIGEYCSKTSGWGPAKHCVTRKQTYCAFNGILPRIIQTQGRVQLQGLASSAASSTIQKSNLSFKFYNGAGGWTPVTNVNGVALTSWIYPAYCATPAQTADAYTADPNAKECPLALTQWFAVCENPAGCGTLPSVPELGSEHWRLSTVNPLKNVTTAISRFAMVTGACDPASTECLYEVAAWPNGIGGKAIASKDLSFPLYSEQAQTEKTLSGVPQGITAMGDFIFRPNSVPGIASPTGPMPASVMLDYSLNGGQSYLHVALPTKIVGTDFSIPDASDVRVTGGCDLSANMCQYTITGTVTVTAKPWGSPKRPDCTGFTLGQLSVLDFSSMDLSEWIASVVGKLQAPNSAALGSLASERTQQMIDARKTGSATMSASSPTPMQAARITPRENFGPFEATLRVSGNWPVFYDDPSKNVDPVTSATIDWGDCTIVETADPVNEFVNGQPSSGYIARHQYASPDKVSTVCGGGRHNLEHRAKVWVYSKSGVHELPISVINTWNSYSGQAGTGGGAVSTTTTTTAPKK